MFPGVSRRSNLESAKGWSAFLETWRTRMKLCLDLNFTRILTSSIGMPLSWVLVEEEEEEWVGLCERVVVRNGFFGGVEI